MKVTKQQLKQIIKEEIARILSEGYHVGSNDEWEISVNVDYNKDPVISWSIGRQIQTGVDVILTGSSEQLDLKSLEAAIKQLQQKHPSDTQTLDDAYNEVANSFKREFA